MIEARRRCELLERMNQRRQEEWQAAADRELEQVAAESWLARFARRGASEKPEARSPKTEDSNPARGL